MCHISLRQKSLAFLQGISKHKLENFIFINFKKKICVYFFPIYIKTGSENKVHAILHPYTVPHSYIYRKKLLLKPSTKYILVIF